MASGRIEGSGCSVLALCFIGVFGFIFVAPVLCMIFCVPRGHADVLWAILRDAPWTCLFTALTVLAAVPILRVMRPRPIPPTSPYLGLPEAENARQLLQVLQNGPGQRVLCQYESAGERELFWNWLAPWRAFFFLWFCLAVSCWVLSLGESWGLLSTTLSPARLAVVLVCIVPALRWMPRARALLEKRRDLDHRLLLDIPARRVFPVDLQRPQQEPPWSVSFDDMSLELLTERLRSWNLVLLLPGQGFSITLETWPEKHSKSSAEPLGEELARRLGLPFFRVQKACTRLTVEIGVGSRMVEVPEERTQIV